MSDRKIDYTAVVIAYMSFIVLGMPGAMLGIVWSPHMRESFSLGLDAVAALLAASSAGYFIASFISGRLFSHFKIGNLLMVGCTISAVTFAGYAVAPVWAMLVALGFISGFGTGILDGGMNIYFAAHFNARLMNWLHASFGIGSTIGPFIISFILAQDGSWRLGYWLAAGLYLLMAGLFFVTRARWLPLNGLTEQDSSAQHTSVRSTLRLPIVWVGIGIFALYAGLEAGTGQWSKSIFYEARGIRETVASSWVALYWLSFTIGRITFGFIVPRVQTERLIRACMMAAILGMALLLWNPFPESGLIAVIFFGFMLSPIFAVMITTTQERMGSAHAANAIGFQVAAATIGVGLLPGLLGIAGVAFGLESITMLLMLMVVVMAGLHELWRRMPVGQPT